MRRKIKKIGNSAGIILSKEDLESYKLKIGDIVDLGDIVKVNGEKKPKKKEKKKEKEKGTIDDVIGSMPQ